jgi:O-antigen chain-terminating methyltransferase
MDDAHRYIQEHFWIEATPPPGARFAWLRRMVARAVAHVFRGQNEFNANVVRTLNALTTTLDTLRQDTDALTTACAALRTDHASLRDALAQQHALLTEHGSQLAQCVTAARDTRTALESLAGAVTARQDALVRAQEQLAQHVTDLSRRQDDLVRTQEQLTRSVADVTLRHDTLVHAQEQQAAAVTAVTQCHDTLVHAQEQLAETLAGHERRGDDAVATLARVTRDVDGISARQDELVTTCADMNKTTAMLVREHRELVGQLTAAQQATAGASTRQDDLVHALEQMQRAIAGVTAHHSELLAHVARLDTALQAQFADALARLQRDEAGFHALHALTDRLREETDAVKGALGAALARVAPAASKPAAAARTQAAATLADVAYARFEDAQRGDEASVRERLRWYLPVLAGVPTTPTHCVLDLGCGRGEFLQLLAEHKLHARGVDVNAVAVQHARRAKLQVKVADLFDELAATRSGTLAAISAFHVLEHLPFDAQVRFFRLAHAALRPDGLLLLEFPNILSIAVAASEFYKDPTHVRPVHPVTVQHWLQEAGFNRIAVSFLHPYPAEAQLAAVQDVAGTITRLNELLFGQRDCAVVAHKCSVSLPTKHAP